MGNAHRCNESAYLSAVGAKSILFYPITPFQGFIFARIRFRSALRYAIDWRAFSP
jgi:hypothetical protein